MLSRFESTFTAGPCMHRCLPEDNATIFINGTHKDINLNSRLFRHESSVGIESSCIQLALAYAGMLPRYNARSHVLHVQRLPSMVT